MADEILQYDADNYRVAGAIDDVGGEIRNIRSDTNGYIQCEAVGIVNDYKVAVTTNDTTPGYLSSKIVDTASVVWTVNNPGANETYSAAVVPGASAFYQTIQEDGVALTQRAIFNFTTYFTVTDNVTKTDITLDIAAIESALDLANIGGLLDLSTQVTGLLSATNIDITNLEATLDLGNIAGVLDLTTQVTGILPVANGGTGASTLTGVLHGNGTSPVTAVPLTTDGAILIGDGAGAPTTLAAFSSSTGTLKVANGGTARASHTAYAVICGGTTSTAAQQSIASVGTAGQVLTSNGAAALPTFQTSPGASNIQTFTVDGTWTKPSNVAWVQIEIIAAGGSGGACQSAGTDFSGTGGAGGQYIACIVPASSLGATEAVTVGVGGASVNDTSGGTNGNPGTDSTFGIWATAKGGAGGEFNTASNVQPGGLADNTGTSLFFDYKKEADGNGASGSAAAPTPLWSSGGGGSGTRNGGVYGTEAPGVVTYGGDTGDGGAGASASGSATATAGANYGAGGGGAATSVGTATSGAGAGGFVRVTSY